MDSPSDEEQEAGDSLPEVPDDGVLLKTLYTGVCRVPGSGTAGQLTCVAGHEVCGKVLALGGKVPHESVVKVGDIIIVYPWPGCSQCEICSVGSPHLCEEEIHKDEDHTDKESSDRQQKDDRFANFQVISDWQTAVRLPREIPPHMGCLLPCGGLRAYAAMLEARPCFDFAVRVRGFANLLVVAGDSVDGLELWCVQLLKNVFCDRNVKVICASRRRDRLDLAIEAGADDAILLPAEATVSQLVDATTMSGYNKMDVSIDLVGEPTSFAVAVQSLHRGGTVIECGEPGQTKVDIPLKDLVSRCITLKAIKAGSLAQLRQLIDVLAIQQVSISIPIEYYRPSELQVATDKLNGNQASGRVVIKYD